MTSGYILIVAILVLGGVIATLGDRIGTRVGKARLSLFNLRPRKTATVVTIITGSLISASTLGILFGLSESLRDGVFELDNILRKLRHARRDVETINTQRIQAESELAKARVQQADVQKRLDATNRNFQQAQAQLRKVSRQASILRSEIKLLLTERQELLRQRSQLTEQITQLKTQVSELKELVAERDQELIKRGQTIAERNQELAEQDQVIAQRETRLKQVEQQLKTAIAQGETRLRELEQLKDQIAQRESRLQELEEQLALREVQLAEQDEELGEREKQLAYLQREVEVLEQYYQNYQVLRQGNVALLRGQVLAFAVVRIVEPSAATQAVDQLLREANRTAVEITQSGNNNSAEPLVQISQTQAGQLINQIIDGQDYVVRIVSAGNYVMGENPIQVFADAALNQAVFQSGDALTAISVDPSTLSKEEIQQRLDQLLVASQFRARRAGVLGQIQVGDGNPSSLVRFIEQLDQYDQPLEVKAVAQKLTYTAGPLKMRLVAIQNGQVIFST